MRKHRQLLQRTIGMALTLLLTLGALGNSAFAAESDQVIDTSRTGSITIHKYAEDDYLETAPNLTESEIAAYIQAHPDELKPLEGVQFRYLKVGELVQYAKESDDSTVVKAGYAIFDIAADFLDLDAEQADIVDGRRYYASSYLDDKLNHKSSSATEAFVDAHGAACSSPTDHNGVTTIPDLELGLYLVCEYVYPGNSQADANHCAPFFVSVPSTALSKEDGFHWDYTIDVAPKNMLEVIHNDKVIIGTNGNETRELDAEIGESVEFLIRSDLPGAIGKLNTYQIIDTLSAGISYDAGSAELWAVADNGKRTRLDEKDHFTFLISESSLIWDLNTAKLADNDGVAAYDSIEIRYTAHLNKSAVVGQEGNENTVKTVYSKYTNVNTDVLETVTPLEPAQLYTYALQLHKVGSDTKTGLSGVTFELTDDSGSVIGVSELAPGKNGQYYLDADGTATLTTDENGVIYVKGLQAGFYYLRETATNNPLYSLLTGKTEIVIHSNECSYIASATGTYSHAGAPETIYCTDSLPQFNRFILPEDVQPETFISFGTSDVVIQPTGESVSMYDTEKLGWGANFTMGDRDNAENSGVVLLEIINNRIQLPKTGGQGDFWSLIIGLCVICTGITVLILTFVRKRKHNTTNEQERVNT